jgi:hypothetical protein
MQKNSCAAAREDIPQISPDMLLGFCPGTSLTIPENQ